jgi:hypothetical protein
VYFLPEGIVPALRRWWQGWRERQGAPPTLKSEASP